MRGPAAAVDDAVRTTLAWSVPPPLNAKSKVADGRRGFSASAPA